MQVASDRPLRLQDLSLVCYDFDGVMTDNRLLLSEDGSESVFVNRGDGLAISMLKKLGVRQIILSTESNPVVAARGRKLGIPVIQGQDDKAAALRTYAAAEGIDLGRAVYIGNDVNDLAAMRLVGHPIAPADAHESIKSVAAFITRARGGEGVVREFFDLISDTEGTF